MWPAQRYTSILIRYRSAQEGTKGTKGKAGKEQQHQFIWTDSRLDDKAAVIAKTHFATHISFFEHRGDGVLSFQDSASQEMQTQLAHPKPGTNEHIVMAVGMDAEYAVFRQAPQDAGGAFVHMIPLNDQAFELDVGSAWYIALNRGRPALGDIVNLEVCSKQFDTNADTSLKRIRFLIGWPLATKVSALVLSAGVDWKTKLFEAVLDAVYWFGGIYSPNPLDAADFKSDFKSHATLAEYTAIFDEAKRFDSKIYDCVTRLRAAILDSVFVYFASSI